MADRSRWNKWAPQFIADLMHDFGLKDFQAAGFVGNFAAESAYFNDIVEDGALAKGWAGGTGFAQWTGPRRKTFEAWIRKKGYKADSYEGNYSYLYRELSGLEKAADHRYVIPLIKAATTAENAAWRVAKYFERPKVINTGPRAKAALEALALYRANPVPPTVWATDVKKKEATVPEEKKVVVSNEPPAIPFLQSPVFTGALAGLGASVYAIFQVYRPGVPLTQQMDTLWPPTVAAIGTALAAYKRWASTAQPLTVTQKQADEHAATVSVAPTPEKPREFVAEAPPVPHALQPIAGLEQGLQQVTGILDVIGIFAPQLGVLSKIAHAVAESNPLTPPAPPRGQ